MIKVSTFRVKKYNASIFIFDTLYFAPNIKIPPDLVRFYHEPAAPVNI